MTDSATTATASHTTEGAAHKEHTPIVLTTGNIPMPKLNRVAPPGRKSAYRDLLANLKVGDGSCIMDETGTDPEKAAQKFSSAVSQYKKTTGDKSKFTVRNFKDEASGKVIVGIWKLEDAPAAAPAAAPAVASATGTEVAAPAADTTQVAADTATVAAA